MRKIVSLCSKGAGDQIPELVGNKAVHILFHLGKCHLKARLNNRTVFQFFKKKSLKWIKNNILYLHQVIAIVFETFSIEDSKDCVWDKLAFYAISGDDVTVLQVLCGNNLPPSIHTSEDLLIEFISDSVQQRTGFRLKYIKTSIVGGKLHVGALRVSQCCHLYTLHLRQVFYSKRQTYIYSSFFYFF